MLSLCLLVKEIQIVRGMIIQVPLATAPLTCEHTHTHIYGCLN